MGEIEEKSYDITNYYGSINDSNSCDKYGKYSHIVR